MWNGNADLVNKVMGETITSGHQRHPYGMVPSSDHLEHASLHVAQLTDTYIESQQQQQRKEFLIGLVKKDFSGITTDALNMQCQCVGLDCFLFVFFLLFFFGP